MTQPETPSVRDSLRRIDEVTWEVPQSFRADMRVPARIYATEELLAGMLVGDAVTQLLNVATLPGIVDFAYGMPDMHDGYGFPVGGVAATRMPDGIVSPGGVGFDINCGVRLLRTFLKEEEVHPRLEQLIGILYRDVPSGVGEGGARQGVDRRRDPAAYRPMGAPREGRPVAGRAQRGGISRVDRAVDQVARRGDRRQRHLHIQSERRHRG